jgi:hypothetical protein
MVMTELHTSVQGLSPPEKATGFYPVEVVYWQIPEKNAIIFALSKELCKKILV